MRFCVFCGSEIPALSNARKYCSADCQRLAAHFRAIEKQKERDGEIAAATIWKERRERHLVKSVCGYCLKFWWAEQPHDFCSEGCHILSQADVQEGPRMNVAAMQQQ